MTWFRQIFARADRSIFRVLVAVAASILGVAVIAIGLTVWWLRSDAIRDATSDTGNLATVLAEQTNLAVQSIDLVLNEIQVRLENLGATTDENYRHLEQDKNTYHALLDSLSHLSQAGVIALIDRNGRVLVTTQKWPSPGVDVSDRDYFQHFKNDDDKGIFVGKPVADRTRGLQTIFFGKRINDASNAFLGMILVGVRVTYFQAIYNSITSLPDQSFLLLRADGTVILRYPAPQNRSGDVIPKGSPWYRLVSRRRHLSIARLFRRHRAPGRGAAAGALSARHRRCHFGNRRARGLAQSCAYNWHWHAARHYLLHISS